MEEGGVRREAYPQDSGWTLGCGSGGLLGGGLLYLEAEGPVGKAGQLRSRVAPTITSSQNYSDLCARVGSIQLWRRWQCSPCLLDELLQIALTEFPVQLLQLLSLGLGVQGTFRNKATTFFSLDSVLPGFDSASDPQTACAAGGELRLAG